MGTARATSGVHLWLVLWKAYDSVRRHALRHIESEGLGLSDFAVLEALLHKGPLPVNAIGALVRLTSGSITTAVDRLEMRQLVERCGDPEDRRARVVHLTSKGEALIGRIFDAHRKAMDYATSGLNAEERTEAARLLKKLGLSAQERL